MVNNNSRIVMKLFALLYLLSLLFITFMLPDRFTGMYNSDNINWQPFLYKWPDISNFSSLQDNQKLFYIKEILGNFLLLMPLGWSVIVLYGAKINKVLLYIIVFLVSLSIESLQYWFHIGTFDIDDLILNTCGGFIGIFLLDILHKRKQYK
jgi:glycopeptide antibiotics resistance protein